MVDGARAGYPVRASFSIAMRPDDIDAWLLDILEVIRCLRAELASRARGLPPRSEIEPSPALRRANEILAETREQLRELALDD
jgi:hypothetical protein